MWYANIIGGIFFFLIGAAALFVALRDLPYTSDFSPGPGFLPVWLGIGLMLASIPIIITEIRNKTKYKSEKMFRKETFKCVQVLVTIITIFLLLPVFGFSIGLAFMTAAGMRLLGQHRWITCSLIMVITAVGIHFVFGQWLSIPLPQGMIGW